MKPHIVTAGPRPAAPASTRERLLDAAIRLFQERGYHGAGLTEILAAAGAPKGSLYHHFPAGKSELALAAIARVRSDYEAAFAQRRARPTRACDMVLWLARLQADWLMRTGWQQGALFGSLASSSIPEAPEIREALAEFAGLRHRLLSQALSEDGVGDAEPLATLALAAIDGGMVAARVGRTREPLLIAVDEVARVIEGRNR